MGSFLGVRFPPQLCEAWSGPPSTSLASLLCVIASRTAKASNLTPLHAFFLSCASSRCPSRYFSKADSSPLVTSTFTGHGGTFTLVFEGGVDVLYCAVHSESSHLHPSTFFVARWLTHCLPASSSLTFASVAMALAPYHSSGPHTSITAAPREP
ncbi:hypothetical protein E2C01_035814 [Portunus trituberculatus]|uniref:Uncharacterized protein n=1 Tax=Portunus trituberculatus TaxID=210409 RepID=A0A5B7F460_PORTR|nr:hypothetical protein [Portunus trituberculatus]